MTKTLEVLINTLEAEIDAMRDRVAVVVAERDALRKRVAELEAASPANIEAAGCISSISSIGVAELERRIAAQQFVELDDEPTEAQLQAERGRIGKARAEARRDALIEAAEFIAERESDYPVSVFIPPKEGEHGRTVDGCSAAAGRAFAKNWSHSLRNMAEEEPPCG